MAVLNSGLQTAWTPEDYGSLVDLVLAEKSIAFQAGSVIRTQSETIRFPLLTRPRHRLVRGEHPDRPDRPDD